MLSNVHLTFSLLPGMDTLFAWVFGEQGNEHPLEQSRTGGAVKNIFPPQRKRYTAKGFRPMRVQYVEQLNEQYTEHAANTVEHEALFYSAKAIASELGISDATVRNRWFPWLCRAVPERLLKTPKGFTYKAYLLFQDYQKRVSNGQMESAEWVSDIKSGHEFEWNGDRPSTDRVPEGSRIVIASNALTVRPSDLLEEVIDVEFESVDTSALDLQTQQYKDLQDDLLEALAAKALNKARSAGKAVGAQVKNAFNQEVAKAYREMVE